MEFRQRAVRQGRPRAKSLPYKHRFGIMFTACLLLGFGLLFTPWISSVVMRFSSGLVTVSAALIRLCGGNARAEGTILRSASTGFAVAMKDGCNAVSVTILLWSAVLAFPASWSQKVKGLLAGSAAIQAINLLRFISLFYLGQYSMSWFDFAHNYLWESLIMLDTLVVFWLWVRVVFRPGVVPSAHR